MGYSPAVAALLVVAAVAIGLRIFFSLLELERRKMEQRIRKIDRELKELEEPARR